MLQNPSVNGLREFLLHLYESFLLWMRLVLRGALFDNQRDEQRFQREMTKLIKLLNICQMLGRPRDWGDEKIKTLLQSGSGALRYYVETIDVLETFLPSKRRARTIPAKGRVPSLTTLSRQGYAPSRYLYALDIALKGIRPRIFRTLKIPGNRTLADLHLCIQNAFGWQNYHLHEFRFDHMTLGEMTDDEDRVLI